LVRNNEPIEIPKGLDVHYEIELVAIMKKSVYNLAALKTKLSADEYQAVWQNLIGGYAIGIPRTIEIKRLIFV
jgi:2-keto-4-pentenoate hydratase/2-oxohepta-3-ene-1,7-dioic acid hydratase in catechol pathway